MDYWSYNSVVKAFAFDESPSTADTFDKDQIGSLGWEVKPSILFGNNMGLFPNETNVANQLFGDIDFPPLMRNSLFNPATAASQNAFSEDNVSSSKIEYNSRDSELFDLKLGRLTDQRKSEISKNSKIAHGFNPSEVSTPPKRPQEGGFRSSIPFCKVHGCNKNLSNCKEYHKRHKVCEVHSKTSKVIVNGIEQRFCQQCSRFHLLREFDDGKRSCRKRLAGHNERRRKPHSDVIPERHRRLLPSCNINFHGNEFNGSTGALSSFQIPDDLRSLYHRKYKTNKRWQMNLDDRTAHDLQSVGCVTDERIHSKSLCPCNFKGNPRFDEYIGASDSVSTGLSGIASSSGSALSLLSSQSQCTSCHSSRIQTSNLQSHVPTWFQGSHCGPNQDSPPLNQHDVNSMAGFEGSSFQFAIDGMFKGTNKSHKILGAATTGSLWQTVFYKLLNAT
ncbi:hypothetical protein L1887_20659 [Cichorium endivia]|nr:hypothetical protein L1887_20659 [Cichorium endivia]